MMLLIVRIRSVWQYDGGDDDDDGSEDVVTDYKSVYIDCNSGSDWEGCVIMVMVGV